MKKERKKGDARRPAIAHVTTVTVDDFSTLPFGYSTEVVSASG